MERLVRLSRLWSWLPSFRAVAETEHLPSAAEQLGVSPPALSRAIALLERDLGQPLFERTGRRLRLNDTGQAFLDATRDGMRRIHSAVDGIERGKTKSNLRISSGGVATTAFVVPALQKLRHAHPKVVPIVATLPPPEVPAALLRGELDLSVAAYPIRHPRLTAIQLGQVPCGVYCAAEHPLASEAQSTDPVDPARLAAYPFVAPPPDPNGVPPDGWPPTLERTIALHVDQLRIGAQVCAQGELLAVLPAALAEGAPPHGQSLLRLPIDVVPPAEVHATFRSTLGEPGLVEDLLDRIRAEIKCDTAGA